MLIRGREDNENHVSYMTIDMPEMLILSLKDNFISFYRCGNCFATRFFGSR